MTKRSENSTRRVRSDKIARMPMSGRRHEPGATRRSGTQRIKKAVTLAGYTLGVDVKWVNPVITVAREDMLQPLLEQLQACDCDAEIDVNEKLTIFISKVWLPKERKALQTERLRAVRRQWGDDV